MRKVKVHVCARNRHVHVVGVHLRCQKRGPLKVITLVNETLLSNELASPSSSGGLGAREGAKEE